jgi:PhnB protein
MKSVITYLTFNGNCRKAMKFYQSCLGGELTFQPVGETPLGKKMPAKMKNAVLHSMLSNDTLCIMGSDMVSDKGVIRGNAVSLALTCTDEEEMKACYKKLSEGGIVTHPVSPTFYGALHGSLTDKFGNQWLVHCEKVSRRKR